MVFERSVPSSLFDGILNEYLRRSTTEVLRELTSYSPDNDYIVFRLEQICCTLVNSCDLSANSNNNQVLDLFRRALNIVKEALTLISW